MTALDNVLSQKYKTMIGLDNIINNSGNTILKNNVTIFSNLNDSPIISLANNYLSYLTGINKNKIEKK